MGQEKLKLSHEAGCWLVCSLITGVSSSVSDPKAPNVVVTKLTLVCATAPGPLELDLTGEQIVGCVL